MCMHTNASGCMWNCVLKILKCINHNCAIIYIILQSQVCSTGSVFDRVGTCVPTVVRENTHAVVGATQPIMGLCCCLLCTLTDTISYAHLVGGESSL